ncbi:MAG: serine/threonine protein kinase [Deltaproteobacteria bacterium]|nr:serine/threonine protein kinase [Deltaproteobacteria bacterium]
MSLPPGPHVDESSRWVGRLIASRYRLLRVVGVGGHGAVYEARHELTGRRFAVKLLLSDPRSIRGLAERLVREAKATSRVTHPNVVEVIDVGVDAESERLYLIEELLEGDDLRARMRARRRMSTQEVRAVIGPVLDGLGAAHAQGVVHRDLKPGNVMLARQPGGEEVPKLIDFGISKLDRQEGAGDESAPLTRDGMLLGTPDYMAPEQARGAQSVDARADLWSVGVLLYEMFAAVRPFRGVGPAGVIVAVAMESPRPLAELRPDLPAAWTGLIHRCLEKSPAERFATALELREAIDVAGDQDPTVLLAELPLAVAAEAPDTLASAPVGPIAAPMAPGLGELLTDGDSLFSEAPADPAPLRRCRRPCRRAADRGAGCSSPSSPSPASGWPPGRGYARPRRSLTPRGIRHRERSRRCAPTRGPPRRASSRART